VTDAAPTPARTAIVTGSASGIGAATVLELARQGYRTVGIDIDTEGAQATAIEAARLNRLTHSAFGADVSDEPKVIEAFDRAVAFLGSLDALVTSAGVGETTPFMDISVATFRAVHDVNVIGTFLCIREAAKRMRSGGRICTIASVAGLRGGGLSGTAAYAASKGGVLALTKSAARSLAAQGICVNTVAPGATYTPMIAEHWKNDAHRTRVESMSVLNRTADAREIAASIAFLVSSQASAITGSTLVADNGLMMY
jgi:NAD(P)-dependent dehydrogenase (short-subunit alcohol dehydrogenase family)